jgi:hypothetical protein
VEQGDAGDADGEGAVDEIEEVGAGGVGMGEEEGDDRAGVAWEEFAVGAAIHAVMSLLDGLLGGEVLLPGSSGARDADEASDLGDLEAGMAVEKEMGEEVGGVIVGALLLLEVESGEEEAALVGGETMFGDLGLSQPGREGVGGGRHGSPSGRRKE